MFETTFTRKITARQGLRQALRSYADATDVKFYQLQHEAMNELIHFRLQKQREGMQLEYMMSPYDGDEINVRISEALAARVKRISNADRCHVNRFLYTALVTYAIRRKLVASHFDMEDLPVVGLAPT